MENKDLQNEIVNSAAEKAATITNEAVETKAAEINETLETKANAEDVLKLAKSIDEVKELATKSFNIGAPKRDAKGEMFAEMASKSKDMRAGDRFSIKSEDYGLSLKDFSIAASSDTYHAFREGIVNEIKYDPNHQTRLTNFLEVYSMPGTGAIRYNQESSHTDNSANRAPGSAAVTASVYAAQAVVEPAQTIIGGLPVPNEWMDEVAGIQDYAMRRLTGDVLDRLDSQILNGSGSSNEFTGINTHAPTDQTLTTAALWDAFLPDSIENSIENANNFDVFTSAAAVLEGENFRPNLVILNPVDYRMLQTLKSNQAEYVVNQALAASQAFSYFGGLRIVPNAAQTAGTFTLIDTSSIGVFMQQGLEFEVGMNDDDFLSNQKTFRAIARGGVAGFRPNGIVTGSLSDGRTALASA